MHRSEDNRYVINDDSNSIIHLETNKRESEEFAMRLINRNSDIGNRQNSEKFSTHLEQRQMGTIAHMKRGSDHGMRFTSA